MTTQIVLPVWTDNQPVGKRIFVDTGGNKGKELLNPKAGKVEGDEFDATPAGLVGFLGSLLPSDFLTSGRPRAYGPYAPQTGLREGSIARTKDHVVFDDQISVLPIDADSSDPPELIMEHLIEAGDMIGLDIASAGGAWYPSSGSGFTNLTTGEDYGNGGCHILLLLDRADAITVILERLHEALWALGYGWVKVGAAGQALERSYVDCSLKTACQPLFAGPPSYDTRELSRKADRHAILGDILSTENLKPLPTLERGKARAAVKAARADAADACEAARQEWRRNKINELVNTHNMAPEKAGGMVTCLTKRGVLLSPMVLKLEDGTLIGAGELLDDREKYNGRYLYDPIEPEMGNQKARFFADQCVIHSYLHGGGRHTLLYDEAGACDRAERLRKLSDCTAAEGAQERDSAEWLVRKLHGRLDTLAGVLKSKGITKESLRGVPRDQAKAKSMEESDDDRREVVFWDKTNLNQMASEIENALAVAPADWTLYEYGPTVCYVEEKAPIHAHGLAAGEAPAKQLALSPYSLTAMTLRLEQSIKFMGYDERGIETVIGVPARAPALVLDRRPAKAVPKVSGIIEAPLVTPDGRVLNTRGFDEGTGLYMSESVELGVLPTPAEAWVILTTEMLGEFTFASPLDQAVAVAMMVSAVQRKSVDKAPAFLLTASEQGSGKTTLALAIHATLTGRSAPLRSWVSNFEESRKQLLSMLMEAPLTIIYDNVYDGSTIACPHLATVLTTPEWTDRVLGVSDDRAVSTKATFIATGNNVKLSADLASRFMPCRLLKRAGYGYKHPDVITYCRANRARWLGAALALAFDRGAEVHGRFPEWDHTVGGAICRASGVDIYEAFTTAAEDSDEIQRKVALLGAVEERFKFGTRFTAAELSEYVGYGTHPLVEFAPDGHWSARTLGKALGAAKGWKHDGRYIEAAPRDKKGRAWFLRKVG